MRRIQDFMQLDEQNQTVVKVIDREESQEAVEIWKGNFHWGVKVAQSDVLLNEDGEEGE